MNLPAVRPHIYLITPGESNAENYEIQKQLIVESAREAARDGVTLIQVRERNLPTRLLAELVAEVKRVSIGASVLVNDRVDVAIAAGADGVHLREDSLPVEVVRRRFGDILIGVSTHTPAGAVEAHRNGASFALLGPVFDTPGKGPPIGLDTLAEVCNDLGNFPVIGLGGIEPGNCRWIIASGAAGIAAIRSLNEPSSRKSIIRRLSGGSMD